MSAPRDPPGIGFKPLKFESPLPASRRLAAVLLLSVAGLPLGFQSIAAVPVEESAPQTPTERSRQPQPNPVPAGRVEVLPGAHRAAARPEPASSTGVAPLFHQLQVLQGELQALRGMVEELRFQIERLAQDQQAQYVDLDQRLMALRAEPQPGGVQAAAVAPAPGRPAPNPSAPDGAGESEQQAYATAFNLMKERAFGESEDAFKQMIETYPNGKFTANGYYWLGELHLAQGQTEEARQNFAQVVNLYASHAKVPDALYKLGVVHHRLGDNQRALEYLDRVQAESPDSSAAGLARTYAAELR